MSKIIEYFIIKYIDLKIWLQQKKQGSTWDLFQFSLFWMLVMVLTSILLGKIL